MLADRSSQELEGICYAALGFEDGRAAQLHAVLLDTMYTEKDDIFFKSFATSQPELV